MSVNFVQTFIHDMLPYQPSKFPKDKRLVLYNKTTNQIWKPQNSWHWNLNRSKYVKGMLTDKISALGKDFPVYGGGTLSTQEPKVWASMQVLKKQLMGFDVYVYDHVNDTIELEGGE